MSAYIATNETYNNVLSGLSVFGNSTLWQFDSLKRSVDNLKGYLQTVIDQPEVISAKDCIKALYGLNVEAIKQRYPDTANDIEKNWGSPEMINTDQLSPNYNIDIYQFLKSLENVSYQCSEGDVIDSPLYKLLQEVINATMYTICHSNERYEQANW